MGFFNRIYHGKDLKRCWSEPHCIVCFLKEALKIELEERKKEALK